LLLGVTPSIATMNWPDGSRLFALDSSSAMVGSVWPGDVPGIRSAACGDWRAIPSPACSFNVVVGDGSLNCVRFPDDIEAVLEELSRTMTECGILVLRGYFQLPEPESPLAVIDDMLRGAIPHFHAFKLRLLMSMQESAEEGVATDKVYRYWTSRNLDVDDVARRAGWSVPQIRSIELYSGTNTVLSFPTLREFRAVLSCYFHEISLTIPSYALGERCPTLIAAPARYNLNGDTPCTL
jgi:hypothetical protein